MSKSYLFLFVRFIVLVAAQVLIVDHINLGGYINPALYLLFIILLPFQIPGWFLLVSSFFLGMSVDIFSNSTGLNAAASVFVAFLRPMVIRGVGAPADYEGHLNPGIPDMGTRWFITYSSVLILIHQFMIGILESFYFAEAGSIFLRMILSSAVTLLIIVIVEYLFMKKKR